MAYEVKVTRQGQTTIPKALREKYRIKEGDTVIYIDLGDHIALLLSPKDPLKILAGLKIDVEETVYEMKKEALKSAQELVDRKLGR
ncbi:hypothetical protein DRO57_01960 [Candidatus Bathyarchaeota archaeon]|nr:MAG: hypothetical protein DRO57_01960 [Candidatus Bathyarchaeota archaeon]